MTVERSDPTGWRVIMDDGNWETKVMWSHNHTQSLITVQWDIPSWAESGEYRLTHKAYAKPSALSKKLQAYSGVSKSFRVQV